MTVQRNLFVLGIAGLAAAASADVITSNFDSDAEGWIVADGDSPMNESTTGDPVYESSGGNGSGFITTPINWPGTAFFVAPEKFLGDQSGKFGGSILVDRRFVRPDSWADSMQVDYDVDLTMTGVDGSMTLAVGLAPVSLDAWDSFGVDLSSVGGWFHLDSGVAATDGEILSLLGDLEDVRVRGNIRDSFARVGIDNFTIVPAPGAAGLLAMAGLGVLRRRR